MYIQLEPLLALAAGIAVLVLPTRLLRYIVGAYLVVIGILGLVR